MKQSEGYPDALKGIAGGIMKVVRQLQASTEPSGSGDREYSSGRNEGIKLPDEYIQHNMVPGREICISDGNSIRRAKALEICPDGRLKVQEEDGSVSSFILRISINYNMKLY